MEAGVELLAPGVVDWEVAVGLEVDGEPSTLGLSGTQPVKASAQERKGASWRRVFTTLEVPEVPGSIERKSKGAHKPQERGRSWPLSPESRGGSTQSYSRWGRRSKGGRRVAPLWEMRLGVSIVRESGGTSVCKDPLMKHLTHATLFVSSLSILSVLAAGCGDEGPDNPLKLEPRSLAAFAGCEDLVHYARTEIERELEKSYEKKYGVGVPGFDASNATGIGNDAAAGEIPESANEGGAPKSDNSGTVPDHSKTNVQEENVDEPDLVKTDGLRLYALSRGVLRVVDLRGGQAKQTDRVEINQLGQSARDQLLIHGNRILVLQEGPRWAAKGQVQSSPSFRISEVDVRVPGQAKVVSTLDLDGHFVSARKTGSSVRVVFNTKPKQLEFRPVWRFFDSGPFDNHAEVDHEQAPPVAKPVQARSALSTHPDWDTRWAEAVPRARAYNKQVLASMTEEKLLPRYRLNRPGAAPQEGYVYGCEQSLRPGVASGVEMLSVLTLDLSQGLSPGHGAGVVARGGMTYAGGSSLYVATQGWAQTPSQNKVGEPTEPSPDAEPGVQARQAGPGSTTLMSSRRLSYVHKFDLSDPSRAVYKASGKVDGVLLNQFAMSEHNGVLRVAATRYVDSSWQPTDSFVSTLQEQGDKLVEMGHVGNLGKTEAIKSVRFMGDVGYVVTFRQTDPLYTLDLSRPEAPQVLGELKIDGFSSYLHPMSPGYLLGVGRDADDQGRIKGLQVSIFDVRDLRAPTRIHNFTLQDTNSSASFDHHAFLHWPQTKNVVLPIRSYEMTNGQPPESLARALVLNVDPASGISIKGEIRHPDELMEHGGSGGSPAVEHRISTMINRSAVVGDKLWTFSAMGIKSSILTDLSQTDWIGYK